jgi:hypothetical protein
LDGIDCRRAFLQQVFRERRMDMSGNGWLKSLRNV